MAADPKNVVHFFGTVPAKQPFNKEAAAKDLQNALDDVVSEYKTVIKILTSHNNAQRQEIKDAYLKNTGRYVQNDLRHDLVFNFEDVCMRLMEKPRDYDAIELHKAIDTVHGTDEKSLTEILVTRSKAEMREIRDIYQTMFQRDLVEDIKSDTSGDYEKVLVALATGQRDEEAAANTADAMRDARQLYSAGEDKFWGTDEKIFIRILTRRSFAQIKEIAKCYRRVANNDLSEAIKDEINLPHEKHFRDACLAIVLFARDPPRYFAERIHDSVDGWGTKDRRLIRQIISRSEIDLALIKEAYGRRYNESLFVAVKCDTSGAYRDIMLEIIKERK